MKPRNCDNLSIKICSYEEALNILAHTTDYHVVSIRDSYTEKKYPFDRETTNYCSIIRFNFDDIHYILDNDFDFLRDIEENVKQMLEWAMDKNNFLFHCNAGISRSSSMAYVLACSRMEPKHALKYIDFRYHYPNEHVVKVGSKILKNPKIYYKYKEVFD